MHLFLNLTRIKKRVLNVRMIPVKNIVINGVKN